jgi:hypothetical protein
MYSHIDNQITGLSTIYFKAFVRHAILLKLKQKRVGYTYIGLAMA